MSHDMNVVTERIHRPNELKEKFPGAIVEPSWMRGQAIRVAAFYAMRLALGGRITRNPLGDSSVVLLTLAGKEYVLTKDNFDKVFLLYQDFVDCFLKGQGYPANSYFLRANPELMLEGLRFIEARAERMLEFPVETIRIYWTLPDEWACGYYRCRVPVEYLKKQGFMIDCFPYCAYVYAGYYDAFVVHRVPPKETLQVIQRLQRDGRTLVYECDDDLFTIPEWSCVKSNVTPAKQQLANATREAADFCFTTTKELQEKMGEEKTWVLPNLINPADFKEAPSRRVRSLSTKLRGFRPEKENGKVRLKHNSGRYFDMPQSMSIRDIYDPLVICWYGSNTHDEDLHQVVPVVKWFEKNYGMAVQFCFMGYCPLEFMQSTVGSGHTNLDLEVTEEYRHCVTFVPPVEHRYFHRTLHQIGPDIGICPLSAHDFNRCKSNIKPLEFAAMRVPSVVTDFGPYRFIESGVNGIKVDGTATQWIKALESLVNDDKTRIAMGDAAYDHMLANHSWTTDNEGRRAYDKFFEMVRQHALLKRHARNSVTELLLTDATASELAEEVSSGN